MEDREFDKIFSVLKDREIIPSDNAFGSLQDALNKQEKKLAKTKLKPIWWAASIIAPLLLSYGIYNATVQTQVEPSLSFSEPEHIESPKVLEAEEKNLIEVVEVEQTPIKEAQELKISPKLEESIKDKGLVAIEKILPSNPIALEEPVRVEEVTAETQIALDNEKKLAELLKPIEEDELDLLLEQRRIAMAIEQLDEQAIYNLLKEAQASLSVQVDSQLASVKADKLLQQAETELEANKSLKSLLSKAIETGVVEVQSLFKRR